MIETTATIASEAPVDGLTLPMAAGDFSRVPQGAVPVLVDHANKARHVVGNVKDVRVDGDRLVANLVIADAELERRIGDGAKPNLSIGFDVDSSHMDGGMEVADAWRLLEVSMVGVGLDPAAGIGRNKENEEVRTRNAPPAARQETPEQLPRAEPRAGEQENPLLAERRRVRTIMDVGRVFGAKDADVELAVAAGDSVADFEKRVRGGDGRPEERRAPAVLPAGRVGDPSAFSLRRLYFSLSENEGCPELERCSDHAATVGGRRSRSVVSIPPEIVRTIHRQAAEQAVERTRTLTVGAAGAGKELVGTTHLASEFVAPLRPQTWLASAGVRVLDGLMGDVEIPGQDGVSTATWYNTETTSDDGTESNIDTETAVQLSPKEAGVISSFSRKLLIQSAPGIESLVVEDQRAVLDRAVESAVIAGSGASGQPKGMSAFGDSDIAKNVAGTNGSDATWAVLVDLWASLAAENIDPMRVRFLGSTKGAAKLLKTKKDDSASDAYLLQGDRVGGRWPMHITNLVASDVTKGSLTNGTTALYCADFGHCVVARWSGLDVVVDPYTKLGQRKVRVATYTDVDVGWRHGGTSMARIRDLKQ